MKKRTITAVLMVLIMGPLLVVGSWGFLPLAMFLIYIAGYEVLKMFEKKDPVFKYPKYIVPLYSSLTSLLWFVTNDFYVVIIMIIIGIFIALMLSLLIKQLKIKNGLQMIFVYLYTGVMLNMAISIRFLSTTTSKWFFTNGFYLIAYLLITVLMTDTGAYFMGTFFGKHKMCPKISPNKTWEGSLFGTIFGIISGTAVYFLFSKLFGTSIIPIFHHYTTGFELTIIVLISLLLSVMGQLGDLFASFLKRRYQIKDYGTIFPGHGGVMDRFDSTIFAGSTLYILLVIVGVI